MRDRWRWRGNVALLGISLAFVLYPLVPSVGVINSDWPAFDTGARLLVSDPSHLYDLAAQEKVEREVTGGQVLVTLGIHGILPFLAPAWVAGLAVPFDLLGPNVGGRAWILFGLLCLAAGLYLVTRPRPPTGLLPAFATVPTALLMLNAQVDGLVVLGLGAAVALWPRRYLAGLALGVTLVKPQLVLPLALATVIAREWKVVAGWATAAIMLMAATLALNPRWMFEWLAQTRSTVQAGAREVDLAHASVVLPASAQTAGLALISLVAVAAVLWLAWSVRGQKMRPAIAILIAGGVVAAPHALPTDLVLVALALALWGGARWFDWLVLSGGALVAALTPDPVPLLAGVIVAGWACGRAAGITSRPRRPEPAAASAR